MITSALKGKTTLSFVEESPNPNAGIKPSSSKDDRVSPSIFITLKNKTYHHFIKLVFKKFVVIMNFAYCTLYMSASKLSSLIRLV